MLGAVLIGAVSYAAAEGITWQVTRQTHLTRFHELRLKRLDPRFTRTVRKHPEAELAEDLRQANQYTAAEKTMRTEILIAVAAGLSAVLGILVWAFVASPVRRVLSACDARSADETGRTAQCILENLAVGSEAAIPNLYVIEDEAAEIFSLGMNPNGSAIVVTTGLLGRLDARELEAVLAHELSHVEYQDMLPATLRAWYTVLVRRPKTGLVSAVARATERPDLEIMADADAVRLTGDPEGLRRALRKLGHDHPPSERLQTLVCNW